jgi:predicted nucleic acid-binding protein
VPRPIVLDTTVLVAAIRDANRAVLGAISRRRVWLSAVTICELLAGTRSASEAAVIVQLSRDARDADRLLVPSIEDWARAGQLIARRVRLHGSLRPRDHLADVLIVASAGRIGGDVVTSNRVHFEIWADLARRSGLDVVVRAEGTDGYLP